MLIAEGPKALALRPSGNRLRLRSAMQFSVALRAQCDEVQVGIIPGVASKLLVMDLQVR